MPCGSSQLGPLGRGHGYAHSEKVFAREGIGLIPLQTGAQYLSAELSLDPASGPIEVVVLGKQDGKVRMSSLKPASTSSRGATVVAICLPDKEATLHIAFERTLTIAEYPSGVACDQWSGGAANGDVH